MAGTEIKTKATDASVEAFLASIENETRRSDGESLLEMFARATGEPPRMWGPAIIGFGDSIYRYPDGREMDWMTVAFSPRKQNLTLYVICESPKQPELLGKLGKHKVSKACLYINKLADVDLKVLEKVIADAYRFTKKDRGGR